MLAPNTLPLIIILFGKRLLLVIFDSDTYPWLNKLQMGSLSLCQRIPFLLFVTSMAFILYHRQPWGGCKEPKYKYLNGLIVATNQNKDGKESWNDIQPLEENLIKCISLTYGVKQINHIKPWFIYHNNISLPFLILLIWPLVPA